MKIRKILNESSTYSKLADDILNFLDKYAGKNPNYDPEYDDADDIYIGPDPYELKRTALQLKRGIKPDYPRSDWGSGSYKPYTSTEGKTVHNDLLKRIKEL